MTWTLHRTALKGGQYQGLLSHDGGGTPAPPKLLAEHEGRDLGTLSLRPITDTPGAYQVTVHLPLNLLSEGIQTVTLRLEEGDILDTLAIVGGLEADQDLRAEVDLLRAELDLLKRAFRRHMRSS